MKALQTSREGNKQLSGGILAILAGASTCGAVSAVSPHLQRLRDENSMVHMWRVPSAHCWRVGQPCLPVNMTASAVLRCICLFPWPEYGRGLC